MDSLNKYDRVLKDINKPTNISFMDGNLNMYFCSDGIFDNEKFIDYIKKQQDSYKSNLDVHITRIFIINNPDDIFYSLKIICLSCLVYLKLNKGDDYLTTQKNNRDLFIQKNSDYGNSFEDFTFLGIIIRLNDKINRLLSLTCNDVNKVKDESVMDTINDLYNYTVISLMYREEITSR